MANAWVAGETEYKRIHGPGSDEIGVEVEVMVTGAASAEAARREADWRARQEADGEVLSISHVRTEGPLEPGKFLVTFNVTTLRYY